MIVMANKKKEIKKKKLTEKKEDLKDTTSNTVKALSKQEIKKAIDYDFDAIETKEENESEKIQNNKKEPTKNAPTNNKKELLQNKNQGTTKKEFQETVFVNEVKEKENKTNSSKIIDLSETHNFFAKLNPIEIIAKEKNFAETFNLNEEITGFYVKYFAIGIVLSAIVYVLLSLQGKAFMSLAVLPLVGTIGISTYIRKRKIAGYEEMFSNFLNDLRDLLQGGMTITQALEINAKNDYGSFKYYVDKLAAQTKIGIPFEKAMKNVFGSVDSPVIKKSVYVITESHSQGGNLLKVFAATSKYIVAIERLKLQRKSVTYSALFTSYLMFFIFLGIIIAIQAFFLPLLSNTTVFQQSVQQPIDFKVYFMYLLLIQCIFAGPMIGKISENSLIGGVRHSLILLAITLPLYLASTVLV